MNYYAVVKGNNTGIFTTWTECKDAINGYSGAVYKKFASKNDAEEYIKKANDKPKKILLKILDTEDYIEDKTAKIIKKDPKKFTPDYYVYTDGACVHNGKSNAKAGFGIYFGENDPRNVSQLVNGKQTNNVAEISAVICAYDIIKKDIKSGKKIMIVTDSVYVMRCLTHYGKKCSKNNWEEDIPNKELVKQAYELYKKCPNVKFMRVDAHTERKDVHSVGNDWADKLANKSLGLSECPYNAKTSKIFLSVPFSQKDTAKDLGAKWDHRKKKWFIESNHDTKKKESLLKMFK